MDEREKEIDHVYSVFFNENDTMLDDKQWPNRDNR